MFSRSVGTEPAAREWLGFNLRDITGTWVSRDGAPGVRIFRNRKCKNGCLYLELTYNNPQAAYTRPVRECFGIRYFDLFGHVGIAHDPERDILLLSAYGEYVRAAELTTN